jgi:N-acetylglucosaminyldiphosphoundecaprenol N-acetyl-beta-D-mannosaminyltransferase
VKPPMKENLLGYPVVTNGKEACIDDIAAWIRSEQPQARWLACINPHSYAIALQDSFFSDALRTADWLIPDGIGIVLASRINGGNINQRVTGSDVFSGVMQHLDKIGGSVFFLGSSNEILEILSVRIRNNFPGVRIAGMLSPPFKSVFSDSEIDEMVSEINAAEPDVLWVGMTSPKQDIFIYSNLNRLRVRFAAGVGAVFDFYTGRVKRSHPIFQKLGLEWFPRLLQQPRRLWRRMFISAPIFVWHLFVQSWRK